MTQTYLAKDRFSHAIQVLKPGIVANVTVSTGGSAKTAVALSGNAVVVRLMATVDTYVSIGPTAAVAAAATSLYLPAFSVEYFRVDDDTTNNTWSVAGLGVSGQGILNITEMI